MDMGPASSGLLPLADLPVLTFKFEFILFSLGQFYFFCLLSKEPPAFYCHTVAHFKHLALTWRVLACGRNGPCCVPQTFHINAIDSCLHRGCSKPLNPCVPHSRQIDATLELLHWFHFSRSSHQQDWFGMDFCQQVKEAQTIIVFYYF